MEYIHAATSSTLEVVPLYTSMHKACNGTKLADSDTYEYRGAIRTTTYEICLKVRIPISEKLRTHHLINQYYDTSATAHLPQS